MDVCQGSPIIVIHSDDEDDDDDVVLVEAEKSADDAEKRDEDDVIFVSEEPSTSVQKSSPRHIKNSERGSQRPSDSSDDDNDDDDSCTTTQIGYFDAELSSVSLVEDALRPLDLSQGLVQTPEVLQSVMNHKLTILKPLAAACSAAFSEQGEGSLEKAVEGLEINPVKIQHGFDLGAGKEVDSSAFLSTPVKVERFTPLKLPEGAEPLASQSLNTPVCRIDPGKECFNLYPQEGKDITLSGGDFLHDSSTSNETVLGKGFPEKERQDLSRNLCGSNTAFDSSQRRLSIDTYVNDTSLTQNVNINSSCGSRVTEISGLLVPLPSTADILDKKASFLDQALATPNQNPSKPHSPLFLPAAGSLNKVNSKPGTSKNPNISQIAHLSSKAHILKSRNPPANGSPLTLDINGLNTEDLSSLLDFFSDEGDLVTAAKPAGQEKLNEPDQVLNANRGREPSSSSGTNPTNVCNSSTSTSATNVCNSEELSGHILSLNISQCTLTDSDSSVLSSSSASTHLTDSSLVVSPSHIDSKSSIPTVSSDRKHYSKTTLSIKRRYRHMHGSRKLSSPHSRSASLHSPARAANCSFFHRPSWRKNPLGNTQKQLINKPVQVKSHFFIKCSDSESESDESLSVKEKTNSAEQLIVSPKLLQKTCKSKIFSGVAEHRDNKRRKLGNEPPEEKPSLKIRLKLLPPEVGAETNSEPRAEIQPSNIGLKKSIIRRHASMSSDSDVQEQQTPGNIHRSLSENGPLKPKVSGGTDQVVCATCLKPVASEKFSKCSKGHALCTVCLEVQVKAILTGDIKIQCGRGGSEDVERTQCFEGDGVFLGTANIISYPDTEVGMHAK